MRLQKYLASCGVASRRECERMVSAGRVSVNGDAAELGMSIDPNTDRVEVDGASVATDRSMYLLLNKPRGTVTSVKDTHGRPTVIDCLGGNVARVFPVGRLDMDVEGVLLLTNDGELAYRLTHPKYEIEKVYLARVEGKVRTATLRELERGIELEDGMTAPARARLLESDERSSLVRLTIHEGRKREVKRMFLAAGYPVRHLKRIAFAGIEVRGMRPGEWRYLTEREAESLMRLAGLSDAPAKKSAQKGS